MIYRDIPKDICRALIRRIESGELPSRREANLVYEDDDVVVIGVVENSLVVEAKSSPGRTVYAGPLSKKVHDAMKGRVQRDREWQVAARESAMRATLGIK
jgi:hypothetical protein